MQATFRATIVLTAMLASACIVAALGDCAEEPATPSARAESSDTDRKPTTSAWEVLFDDGMSAIEYARQLDYFGIELAAVAKNGQIQYASHLSDRKAARRIGEQKDEPRMSVYWKRGNLGALEGKLLAKAGINTKDKTLTHYYPQALEARLAVLERNFAGRDSAAIRRTRFKIRPLADQPKAYEFYVDEQDVNEGQSAGSTTGGPPSSSRAK